MSIRLHPRLVRTALVAAGLGLAATAAMAEPTGLSIVVGTCPPSTAAALHTDLKLSNGAVVKPGRNPPSSYFCNVPFDDYAAASTPDWNTIELQFSDRNPRGHGHVRASLMRKSLASGAAMPFAVVESVPSDGVQRVRARLRGPLDFSAFAYYVIVELQTPQEPVEAHLVRLTRR